MIQATAGVVAGVLIVRGVFALRRSRVRAYRAFEFAILVDLLLSQPFAFLDVGFGAAVAVFIDLGLLATLRYLQTQERKLRLEFADRPICHRRGPPGPGGPRRVERVSAALAGGPRLIEVDPRRT